MKKITDPQTLEQMLQKCNCAPVLKGLNVPMFVLQYEPGEYLSSPWLKDRLFQVVVEGSFLIYYIRDDGSRYSLAKDGSGSILGEMELLDDTGKPAQNIYAEVEEAVNVIAFETNQNREQILNDAPFVRMIAESLARRIAGITHLDAAPVNLRERVLSYMSFKCPNGVLEGIEQAAFHLRCSARQLQRILNSYEAEGIVQKTGKGKYKLL